MANVQEVVDLIIEWAHGSGEHITHMWLQKLLYFAQGQHLARTGTPLFPDKIEAWQYGPVVPDIYHKYKVCGNSPIPKTDEETVNNMTTAENDLLYDVLREYGIYNANELMRQSHKTEPWIKSYNGERHQEIPLSDMREYFSDPSRKIKSFNEMLSEMAFEEVTKRDADGYLILDKEDADDNWEL